MHRYTLLPFLTCAKLAPCNDCLEQSNLGTSSKSTPRNGFQDRRNHFLWSDCSLLHHTTAARISSSGSHVLSIWWCTMPWQCGQRRSWGWETEMGGSPKWGGWERKCKYKVLLWSTKPFHHMQSLRNMYSAREPAGGEGRVTAEKKQGKKSRCKAKGLPISGR